MEHASRLWKESGSVASLAAAISSGVVVSHGPAVLTAALAARRFGLRHILLLHSDTAPAVTATVMRIVGRPEYVFYETVEAFHKYRAVTHRSPCGILEPAVDEKFFARVDSGCKKSALAMLAVQSNKCVVAFIGMFSPRKAPEKVLDLAALLQRSGVDYAVRLIGRPATSHVSWFEAEIAPRMEGLRRRGVDIALADGADRIPEMLSVVDALLLTSASEGIPNVVLEALCAGVPVVSLELPGLLHLAQYPRVWESVTIVRRGSDEVVRLASALDATLRISQAERASTAAAARVVFSADYASRQLAEILNGSERAR